MIEIVSPKNLEELLPLIRQYQAFYNVQNISDDRNRAFFSQFGESNPSGCQFLFRQDGDVVGFSTVYFSYATTSTGKVGILNDLYTVPSNRGKGVGRQLIEHSREYASRHGASRLQWVTAPENKKAQKLYESMDANKSTWLFYAYDTYTNYAK